MNLREAVAKARQNKVAVGHFNVCTLDGMFAVADAAKELGVPVIVGVSEGERDYTGVREIMAAVRALRMERSQEIFMNADHTYSFERVKEAIDAGYDSVIFDGAKLSLEDNIGQATKCVEYAKQVRDSGSLKYSIGGATEVLIEGELGYIGQSSKVLDAVPTGVQLTDAPTALRFVRETGVDMLAPAVGNFHGVLAGSLELTREAKHIDPARIAEIEEATGVPLVLHGGSGQGDDLVRKAIAAGMAIVHVNTELRIAYRAGLMKALTENPDEISPYKYLKPAKQAMQAVVLEKLKLFNNL